MVRQEIEGALPMAQGLPRWNDKMPHHGLVGRFYVRGRKLLNFVRALADRNLQPLRWNKQHRQNVPA